MPVTGRSLAGLAAFLLSVPLCRLTGLTEDASAARGIGALIAATDAVGVLQVVGAGTPSGQKRAAIRNVVLDLALASGLVALGVRRTGPHRVAALIAAGSVYFGAAAWAVGAARITA
jgi:hypothetical protein